MTDKPLTDIALSSFDLHPSLLEGLTRAGFTRCTPIQALTLPLALHGRDVAGQAQTGTGKTLAFLVATIDRLLKRPALATRGDADPRALILAPTRELAIQIHKDALAFGSALGIKYALVYGGVDYDKQREILQHGADIIIATPGRLIDYVKQHKVVSLHACEVCVLDEADRMFDLGFIKDIRFLLRRMPGCKERQTLLFSATLSHRVLELAYEHMNEPEKLVVETESVTTARVRQKIYFPANEEKIPLLIGLLTRTEGVRTMVFVNTKAWVENVAKALERAGFRVGVISGDVPQKKRESLLNRFKRADLEILVATDVAARGLHIDGVSHVFNFDLPFDAEDYVHRIGRTARLGAEGDAISFACERYAQSLPDIEAYIEQKIPTASVDPELLVPVPRKPRAPVPQVEGEEPVESISQIYREVRQAQKEEGGHRGGGRGTSRGGSSRGSPAHGGRPGGAGRSGSGHAGHGSAGHGGSRRAHGGHGAHADAQHGQAAAASGTPHATPAVSGTDATSAPAPALEGAERTRKPRRRRGGRRRSDGENAAVVTGTEITQRLPEVSDEHAVQARDGKPHAAPRDAGPPAHAPEAKAPTAKAAKASLFAKLKQGLKKLVKRPPRSGH
ncbi:MAG: ATP-dependent RNA helicase RhlB [Proteobacteria bacterium]|nr:ATP-dependent RNA helicase RhlB [Pseudomonadota bacterium]